MKQASMIYKHRKGIAGFGGTLFVTGLLLFIATIWLSDYQLPENYAVYLGTEKKDSVLDRTLQPLTSVRYHWSYSFTRDMDSCFRATNSIITKKYAVGDSVLSKIMDRTEGFPSVFSSQWIEETFAGHSSDVSDYQRSALNGRTAWMEGQTYATKNELRTQLEKVRREINRNIVYEKGFGSYEIKTLKFELTKASSFGLLPENSNVFLVCIILLWLSGAALHFTGLYAGTSPGIQNNQVYKKSLTTVGGLGIALGTLLIAFYVVLYFFPQHLVNWVIMVDPLSKMLNGSPAGHWFMYGFLYTFGILVMGAKMLAKYRHSNYHILRTCSVMFFQTAFAFIIPEILVALNKPYYDFKNIWPLDYDFFYGYNIDNLIQSGALGYFMLFWGIGLVVVAVPVFTYFYGKRWYCSWVCGCGGLAETVGDPFRHLSDKSLKAWKIERWMVHGVLVFAVVNTVGVLYTYFSSSYSFLGIPTETLKTTYGFLISSIFAGVIGTGFYPLMGNRVWCRFGCPLAAYLGIVQRFKSRFRITTNGGQCISCGNCSVYCEMGIDVRWYAQRGQNIVRASCVGCGICAAVCPRGVLRLENRNENGRLNNPVLTGNESTLNTREPVK
jgi:polyferredoxin